MLELTGHADALQSTLRLSGAGDLTAVGVDDLLRLSDEGHVFAVSLARVLATPWLGFIAAVDVHELHWSLLSMLPAVVSAENKQIIVYLGHVLCAKSLEGLLSSPFCFTFILYLTLLLLLLLKADN